MEHVAHVETCANLTHDLCPPVQRTRRQIVQAIGFTYEQHMSTHHGAFFAHEHHILTRCATRLVYLGLIKYETRRTCEHHRLLHYGTCTFTCENTGLHKFWNMRLARDMSYATGAWNSVHI